MTIPCCFFPTQTIFLDDNPNFLESMNIALGKHQVFKLFETPRELIDYLTQVGMNPFTKRCLHRPEEMEPDHRTIDVDISAIHQELYNPHRFLENTVLVIDYAMPSMHGIDVCKALRHLPIKKIMLTAEADDKIAIDAFNQGLIDKFIRKGVPSVQVANAISELQKKYFIDLSTIVIDSLTKNPEYPPSCLDDPLFVKFFNELCAQQKYTECYLLDAMGSFLFLDDDANPTFLMVKDEEGMQSDFETVELSDAPINQDLLNALKNKEKLLYFFEKTNQKTDPQTWNKYTHSAKKIAGKYNYYYAISNDPNLYDIKRDKILSYGNYLRSL
jgi:CheY-like chemotaxis protein